MKIRSNQILAGFHVSHFWNHRYTCTLNVIILIEPLWSIYFAKSRWLLGRSYIKAKILISVGYRFNREVREWFECDDRKTQSSLRWKLKITEVWRRPRGYGSCFREATLCLGWTALLFQIMAECSRLLFLWIRLRGSPFNISPPAVMAYEFFTSRDKV